MKKLIFKGHKTWYGGGGSGSGPSPSGCCYELITVAALQALVAANNMVQGTFYQITDVTPDWQVVMLAESTSELSTQGQGIYQNSLYTEAYYSLNTNTLEKIYDPTYRNSVAGSLNIAAFPWNLTAYNNNEIDATSSFIGFPALLTSFSGNRILQGSTIDITNVTVTSVDNNNVLSGSTLSMIGATVNIVSNNYIYDGSTLFIDGFTNNGNITNNTIADSTSLLWNTLDCNGSISNNQFYGSTVSGALAQLTTFTSNNITDSVVALNGAVLPYVESNVFNGATLFFNNSNVPEFYGNVVEHSQLNVASATVTTEMNYNRILQESLVILSSSTLDTFINNSFTEGSFMSMANNTKGLLLSWNTFKVSSSLQIQPNAGSTSFAIEYNSCDYCNINLLGNTEVDYIGYNIVNHTSLDINALKGTLGTFEITDNTFIQSQIDLGQDATSTCNNVQGNIVQTATIFWNPLVATGILQYNLLNQSGVLFVDAFVPAASTTSTIEYNHIVNGGTLGLQNTTELYFNTNTITDNSEIRIENHTNSILGDYTGNVLQNQSEIRFTGANANDYLNFKNNILTSQSSINDNAIGGMTGSFSCEDNTLNAGILQIINSTISPYVQQNCITSGSSVVIDNGSISSLYQTNLSGGSNITINNTTYNALFGYNTLTASSVININNSVVQNIQHNNLSSTAALYINDNIENWDVQYNNLTSGSSIDIATGAGCTFTAAGCRYNNFFEGFVYINPNTKIQNFNDNIVHWSEVYLSISGDGLVYENTFQNESKVYLGQDSATYVFERFQKNTIDASTVYFGGLEPTLQVVGNYIKSSTFNMDNAGTALSDIVEINNNSITNNSTITFFNTLLATFNENVIENASTVNLTDHNAPSGNIQRNSVRSGSSISLTGSGASTYVYIRDNEISANSTLTDSVIGTINIADIRGNTVFSYGTFDIRFTAGTQVFGNVVQAGLFQIYGFAFNIINFNHVLRANMVLGFNSTVITVRSNHLVGPSSGTYANLTTYGPITLTTLEGNAIFDAGRIEAIYTAAQTCTGLDWNMVANTSAVLFTDTQFTRFGGSIIGDRGGNVVDNGSVLTFTGGSFAIISDNQFNKCTANITTSTLNDMRRNVFQATTLNIVNVITTLPINANTTSGDSAVNINTVPDGVSFSYNTISGNSSITITQGETNQTFNNNEIGISSTIYAIGFAAFNQNIVKQSSVYFDYYNSNIEFTINNIQNSSITQNDAQTNLYFRNNQVFNTPFLFNTATIWNDEIVRNNFQNSSINFSSSDGTFGGLIEKNNIFTTTIDFNGATITTNFNTNEITNCILSLAGNAGDYANNRLFGSSIATVLNGDITNFQSNYLHNSNISAFPDPFGSNLARVDVITSNVWNFATYDIYDSVVDIMNLNNHDNSTYVLMEYSTISSYQYNNTEGDCGFYFGVTSYTYQRNTVSNCNTLSFLGGTTFENNIVSNLTGSFATDHSQQTAIYGLASSFEYDLDLSDNAVFSANQLTLTGEQAAFGGIFKLINGGVANLIDDILNNTPNKWPYRFYNSSAGTVQFSAGAGNIYNKGGANIVIQPTGKDFAEYIDYDQVGNNYENNSAVY